MIGVGGSGMCGAARMLVELGGQISGSDLNPFDGIGELVARGVRVDVGHSAVHLDADVEFVVISAAIPESNPELSAARARGLRVIQYAELLGEIMAYRQGVAIAGTHGKSTTTALCAHLYRECGLAPSFVIGAGSAQLGGSSGVGPGPHFIVESCEFNRSFLHLTPMMAAVLNVESDHLDYYKDLAEIIEAFGAFCAKVHPDGVVVANADDPASLTAAGAARCRVATFGFGEAADYRAVNLEPDSGRFRFDIALSGHPMVTARLAVPGRYNVYNALAATALTHATGASLEVITQALERFAGIERRLSLRYDSGGLVLLDDYGHHPTEIRVTLEAARERYGPKRLRVVFQPHQYSRTIRFLEDFADAFQSADEVIVPEIFLAREKPGPHSREGAELLAKRIAARGIAARYVRELDVIRSELAADASDGDVIVTMGAGDVYKVADGLAEHFNRTR